MSQPGSLGGRLKAMRRAAGLTQAGMAADLGWPTSKISKIERGNQLPTSTDIQAITDRTGQQDAAEELLDLLAAAEVIRDDARRPTARSQAGRQVKMDERTKAAKLIRDVEPLAIPGWFQAPGYARAIAEQVQEIYGARDIDAAVQARMDRKLVLYERDNEGRPARQFDVIMTEAVLYMVPCPAHAMLAQLYHLLELLDLDNVSISVIPMGVSLGFAPFFGFLMLDRTVIIEDYMGSNLISSEEAVAKFELIFTRLQAQAVTGRDAVRQMITAAAGRLRASTGDQP